MDYLNFLLVNFVAVIAISNACPQEQLMACMGMLSMDGPSSDLTAICQGFKNYQNCLLSLPSSCDGPVQAMLAEQATLQGMCAGSTVLAGGTTDNEACPMIAVTSCLEMFKDVNFTTLADTNRLMTGDQLQKVCGSMLNFTKCLENLPPQCQNSPLLVGFKNNSAEIDKFKGLCKSGCDFQGILTCTRPIQKLDVLNLHQLPTSAVLSDTCSKFQTYRACVSPLLPSCKDVNEAKEMIAKFDDATRLIKFLCEDNLQVLMKHKDCYDDKDVRDRMDTCTANFSIMHPNNRNASDAEKCRLLEEEKQCVGGYQSSKCSKEAFDTLVELTSKASLLVSEVTQENTLVCEEDGGTGPTDGSSVVTMGNLSLFLMILSSIFFF